MSTFRPWMSVKDISIIEDVLLSLSDNLEILEWGSGGSTKYFTEFLTKQGIDYFWTSIEYNKKWFNKVAGLNLKNVDLRLFDCGNDKLKQFNTNMDQYVDFPKSLNKQFDLILVDGRKRRRCLVAATELLKVGGIVLLHDAQRQYYHCAFDNYTRHLFLSKTLWGGYVE